MALVAMLLVLCALGTASAIEVELECPAGYYIDFLYSNAREDDSTQFLVCADCKSASSSVHWISVCFNKDLTEGITWNHEQTGSQQNGYEMSQDKYSFDGNVSKKDN